MKTIVRNLFCSAVMSAAVLLTPLISSAALVDYSLAGSVWEGIDRAAVWGNLTVNNEPTPWVGPSRGRETFHVSSFSVYSPVFTFTGNSGELYFEMPKYGTIGDTMWWLDGTMTWAGGTKTYAWVGEMFWNLNKDGTYNTDLNNYETLASIFAMDALVQSPVFPWSDPKAPQNQGSTIVAYLNEASVPEPSTFLQMLCGVVLLSLAGWRAGIRVN